MFNSLLFYLICLYIYTCISFLSGVHEVDSFAILPLYRHVERENAFYITLAQKGATLALPEAPCEF